jgi:hypothetical protein
MSATFESWMNDVDEELASVNMRRADWPSASLTLRVRALLESRWEAAGKPREGWVWPSRHQKRAHRAMHAEEAAIGRRSGSQVCAPLSCTRCGTRS